MTRVPSKEGLALEPSEGFSIDPSIDETCTSILYEGDTLN
jgi:hypothetical protein